MTTKTKDPSTGMLGSEINVDTPNDISASVDIPALTRDIEYSASSPSVDQMMDDVTTSLLENESYMARVTGSTLYKAPEQISALLLKLINLQIHNHNVDSDSGKRIESELRWKPVDSLPPRIIARLAAFLFDIRYVVTEDDDRSGQCAVYDEQTGLYSTDVYRLRSVFTRFNKNLSARDEARIFDYLPVLVPRVVEDSCRYAVPVKNGIFDLGTRALVPFTPERVYLSKIDIAVPKVEPEMPIAPDGRTLLELLTAPWPSDCVRDNFQGLMWQILRSVVVGSHGEAVHFYGQPLTGKSVFVDLCAALVGKKYSRRLSLSDATNRFGLSTIVGAKLLYDAEMGGRKFLESDNVKRIITGDTLTIEDKYKTPFAYRNRALWIMAGNSGSMSSFDDKSTGVAVRFIHVPFTHKMQDCRDSDVSEFLTSEPCLEWTLWHVLHDVQDFKKFDRPLSVQRADAEVAEEMGVMPSFISWLTDIPSYLTQMARVMAIPRDWLYDKYLVYVQESAPNSKTVMGLPAFMRALEPYLDKSQWQNTGDYQFRTPSRSWHLESTRRANYSYTRVEAVSSSSFTTEYYLQGRHRGLLRVDEAYVDISSTPDDVVIRFDGSVSGGKTLYECLANPRLDTFFSALYRDDVRVDIDTKIELPDAFLHRLVFPLGERGYTQKTRRIFVNGVAHEFTLERPQ